MLRERIANPNLSTGDRRFGFRVSDLDGNKSVIVEGLATWTDHKQASEAT
jgi:hypothetical protein